MWGGVRQETQLAARGAQQGGTAGPHPRQGQRFLGMTLNHPLFPHVPLPTLPEKRKNQAPFSGSKRPSVGRWGLSQPLATHSEPSLLPGPGAWEAKALGPAPGQMAGSS